MAVPGWTLGFYLNGNHHDSHSSGWVFRRLLTAQAPILCHDIPYGELCKTGTGTGFFFSYFV